MCTTTAWQWVSPEVTVKGFKKCCISNAGDKNDEDVLWNGSEEDGNVKSGCQEDEGTDNEDIDSDTNSKIFYLSRHFFFWWGGSLFWINTFSLVKNFTYLGSLINVNNDNSAEIKKRILLANKGFYGLLETI